MGIHYRAGQIATKRGESRAAPSNLKIVTQPWRDWYAGFDAATIAGNNSKLNTSFSLRKAGNNTQVYVSA